MMLYTTYPSDHYDNAHYDTCPAPDDVQLWRRCFVAFADGYCRDRRVGDIYFDEFDGDTMCLLCVGKTQE